jgi:hypothetical protein
LTFDGEQSDIYLNNSFEEVNDLIMKHERELTNLVRRRINSNGTRGKRKKIVNLMKVWIEENW